MGFSFNPLEQVIENSQYPLARIYRGGLKTGITDTFHVLMGRHLPTDYVILFLLSYRGGNLAMRLSTVSRMMAEFDTTFDTLDTIIGEPRVDLSRIGVLDLLVFPLVSRKLIELAFSMKTLFPLNILMGGIGLLLEIPRVALAATLTVALSPIVMFVHLLAFPYAQYLKSQALNLQVNVIKHNSNQSNDSFTRILDNTAKAGPQNLETYLSTFSPVYSDINLLRTASFENAAERVYRIKNTNRTATLAGTEIGPDHFEIPEDQKSTDSYKAFEKLNVGRLRRS